MNTFHISVLDGRIASHRLDTIIIIVKGRESIRYKTPVKPNRNGIREKPANNSAITLRRELDELDTIEEYFYTSIIVYL